MSDVAKRFVGERSVNWIALVLVLVVLGGAAAGVFWVYKRQVARQADEIRAQIARAEAAGGADLDKLYELYLRVEPRDAEALQKYGERLSKSAKTSREKLKAIGILDRAVRESPSNVALRQALVGLALQPGFDAQCNPDPHLQALIEAIPASAVPCEQLAERAEARGDFARAEALLREGLKREEARVSTRVRLAKLLHFRLKKEDEARALLGEGTAKNAKAYAKIDVGTLGPADRLGVAEFWREVGETQRSQRIVDEALKAFPEDADVLLASARDLEDLAGKASEQGRKELKNQAIERLKKGLQIAPDREDSYVRLAYAYLQSNRQDDARAILEKGLAAIPSSFGVRWAQCESLLSGTTDDASLRGAERVIEDIRAMEPQIELVQFLEARLNITRRRWLEAAQGLTKALPALARQPLVNRQALLMQATCYRELGEPVLREAAYRRLLGTDPLNIDAHLGLGETLADQKRYAESLEQLGRIARHVAKENQARLQATMLIALVGREALKESGRQWDQVDKALGEFERELAASDALDAGQKLEWRHLLLDLRVERLAKENRFRDAVPVVDAFVSSVESSTDGAIKESARKKALANAYRSKASLLVSLNDEAKARAALAEGRKKTGDGVALRIAEAQIECARGFPKDAAVLDKLVNGEETFEPRERLLLLRSLASIRQRASDYDGAMALYRRAAELSPHDLSIQRSLFLLALDSGDLEQARKAAAALAAMNAVPGSPAACAEALLALEGFERSPNPSELRKQAVNLQGSEAHLRSWIGVWRALGRIAELENKPKEAISRYRSAFDPAAPSHRIARRLLHLNYQVEDYAESRRWFLPAKLDTADQTLLKCAAETAVRVGDFAATRALVARAAPLNTNDVDLAIWGGVILQAAQSTADAERLLRRAVEAAPGHPRPLAALVEMLVRHERKSEARQALEAAYKNIPPARLPLVKARCEEAYGDLETARRSIEDALKQSPANVEVLRYAVDFYVRRFELHKALDAATQLQREPSASPEDRAFAARMKGIAFVAAGRTEDARRSLADIGPPTGGATGGDFKLDIRSRAVILALQPSTQSWRDALAELKRLEELDVAEISDQLIAAQLERNLGDWPAAKSRLSKSASRLKRDDPRVLGPLVHGMLDAREPIAQIEPWLERLERSTPRDAGVLLLRARFLQQKDQSGASFVAKSLGDKTMDALTAGMILVELSDPSAAAVLRSAAGDVTNPETREQIAAAVQLLRVMAKSDKAVEALRLCNVLRSKLPPAVYAQTFLEILQAVPNPPHELTAAFADWLRRTNKENPKDYSLRLAAASLESCLGRQSEAISQLTSLKSEIPSTDPIYAGVVNNLALLSALVDKKGEQAERTLEEQIAAAPNLLELRDTLGVVRLEIGKIDQALADFKELTLLSPKGAVYYHLARAQSLKGDRRGAEVSLGKARGLGFRREELHALERPHYDRLVAELKIAAAS
jgi:cellulose synthase operon protein C